MEKDLVFPAGRIHFLLRANRSSFFSSTFRTKKDASLFFTAAVQHIMTLFLKPILHHKIRSENEAIILKPVDLFVVPSFLTDFFMEADTASKHESLFHSKNNFKTCIITLVRSLFCAAAAAAAFVQNEHKEQPKEQKMLKINSQSLKKLDGLAFYLFWRLSQETGKLMHQAKQGTMTVFMVEDAISALFPPNLTNEIITNATATTLLSL